MVFNFFQKATGSQLMNSYHLIGAVREAPSFKSQFHFFAGMKWIVFFFIFIM